MELQDYSPTAATAEAAEEQDSTQERVVAAQLLERKRSTHHSSGQRPRGPRVAAGLGHSTVVVASPLEVDPGPGQET